MSKDQAAPNAPDDRVDDGLRGPADVSTATHERLTRYLQAIADSFGPDEGVEFTQASWASIRGAMLDAVKALSLPSATRCTEEEKCPVCGWVMYENVERSAGASVPVKAAQSATASPEVAAQDAEAVEIAREYLSLERTLISGEDISQLCRALVRRADSRSDK